MVTDISIQAERVGYEVAAKMVKNYSDRDNGEVSVSFIDRKTIEDILSQDGVEGISIIAGRNKEGEFQPIIVGTTLDGKYITNVSSIGAEGKLVKQKGIIA